MTAITLPTFLTLDADGTTRQATGDYSSVVARFKIGAVENILDCKYLTIQTSQTDALWTNYAGLTLTNGIKFRIEDGAGSVIHDLFEGIAFKTNRDFEQVGALVVPSNSATATIGVQIVLPLGERVTLKPDTDRYLVAYLNDDYSAGGLTAHTMWVSKDKGGF